MKIYGEHPDDISTCSILLYKKGSMNYVWSN